MSQSDIDTARRLAKEAEENMNPSSAEARIRLAAVWTASAYVDRRR